MNVRDRVRSALGSIGHLRHAQRELLALGVSLEDSGRILSDVQRGYIEVVNRALNEPDERPAGVVLAPIERAILNRALTASTWTPDEIADIVDGFLVARVAPSAVAAWDQGYMRGRFPWIGRVTEGQADPIPPGHAPPRSGANANPYRVSP